MVKELIKEASIDARRLSLPLAVVISFLAAFSGMLVVFAAWGLHGNVNAWKMQTERQFLQTAARQRAEDLAPIRESLDELIQLVKNQEKVRQQESLSPFTKHHYEILRKSVGQDWLIYDEIDSLARHGKNSKH